jgi:hypothetical protein
MRAIEHATLPDIAATLSKALGRRVAVPALHKRIKRTAASYPVLAAILTPRLAATRYLDAPQISDADMIRGYQLYVAMTRKGRK